MSYDRMKQIEEDEGKQKLKMAVVAVILLVAVGLAIWSGVRSQQPPIKIVGTLGADGKINYYPGQAPSPPAPVVAPAVAGVPAPPAPPTQTINSTGNSVDPESAGLPPSKQ